MDGFVHWLELKMRQLGSEVLVHMQCGDELEDVAWANACGAEKRFFSDWAESSTGQGEVIEPTGVEI